MSFRNDNKYPFTETGIRMFAPNASGVYAIFNDGHWIYIGESVNIADRLLQHLRDGMASMHQYAPQYFSFETCGALIRVARQDALILEMAPTCNRRLG